MDKPAQKPDDVNGLLIRPAQKIISGFFDRRREIYAVPVFVIGLFLLFFVFSGSCICEKDTEVIHEVMTEVFKSRAIAVGSPTVSNSYLSSVAGWLEFLKQLKFKNKKAAAFGCYGWSGESVKLLQAKLAEAGFEVIEENIRSQWNPEDSDFAGIPALVTSLIGKPEEAMKTMDGNDGKPARYQCGPCGYVYDPEKGDPDSSIEPGTAFEDLPDDWCCPICGVSKDMFEKVG